MRGFFFLVVFYLVEWLEEVGVGGKPASQEKEKKRKEKKILTLFLFRFKLTGNLFLHRGE